MSIAERERLKNYLRAAPESFPAKEFAAALDGAADARTGDGELVFIHQEQFLARILRHQSAILYSPAPASDRIARRLAAFDPGGELIEASSWTPGGALAEARLKLPAGGWARIEPAAAQNPMWGLSDRVSAASSRRAESWDELTVLRAIPWQQINCIPPGAEPARLVKGSGSLVLNYLAGLLTDQGARSIRYRGPYPSDQLFDSLQESFSVLDDAETARMRFTGGAVEAAFSSRDMEPDVDFAPAPFELCLLGEGGSVFLREGPEKCFFRGLSYVQAAAYPLRTPGPRCVWNAGGPRDVPDWLLGVWLLGEPLEIHGRLDLRDHQIIPLMELAEDFSQLKEASAGWHDVLSLLVIARAAPPLQPALREVLSSLKTAWCPLHTSLARLQTDVILLRNDLGKIFKKRTEGISLEGKLDIALRLAAEVAADVLPALFGAAQTRLAAADGKERARLLSPASIEETRRWLSASAPALASLCGDIARGRAFAGALE